MSLKVRLEPGDDPKIIVTGEIVEKMRREHLKDLLMGGERPYQPDRKAASRRAAAQSGCPPFRG